MEISKQGGLLVLYRMLFEQLRAVVLDVADALVGEPKAQDILRRRAEQGRDIAFDFTQPHRPVAFSMITGMCGWIDDNCRFASVVMVANVVSSSPSAGCQCPPAKHNWITV